DLSPEVRQANGAPTVERRKGEVGGWLPDERRAKSARIPAEPEREQPAQQAHGQSNDGKRKPALTSPRRRPPSRTRMGQATGGLTLRVSISLVSNDVGHRHPRNVSGAWGDGAVVQATTQRRRVQGRLAVAER